MPAYLYCCVVSLKRWFFSLFHVEHKLIYMPIGDALLGTVVDFGLDQLSGAISGGRNLKNWRRMNDYNHPRAQMQRLQEAGLNPNLVYGSGANVGNADSVDSTSTPTTSRYQDARMRSAQLDLVQLERDLAEQKLAQARIATEAQASVHAIMRAHPDRVVSVTSPDGGTIEVTQPAELDRYQTQALARHQITLTDAELKEIDRIVKGDLSYKQAFENLVRTRQMTASERERTEALRNNNKLWEAVEEGARGMLNPADGAALFLKLILSSIFKQSN